MTNDDDDVGEICSFGIDGATGAYLPAPHTEALADNLIEPAPQAAANHEPHWGVLDGDTADLSDAGWGLVLLDPDGDPREAEIRKRNDEILAALNPLLAARRAVAGDRFKVMLAKRGTTRSTFLARYGQGDGQLDTRLVPYYFLIAASPDELDFTLQCSLDVQAAVGRLWFEGPDARGLDADGLQRMSRYAESYREGRIVPAAKRAEFFCVENDPATRSASVDLVTPVFAALDAAKYQWTKDIRLGQAATRAELLARFTGATPAGLVFVATHGVAYPKGDPRQDAYQGALVCNEWPGGTPPTDGQLIASADVGPDANLAGTTFFIFACYGVGTPRESDFVHLDRNRKRLELSDRARVAPLAQRLLERGAPAVIGHVERAWTWSYGSPKLRELGHFEVATKGILRGQRIGSALEAFGQRYADAAVTLANALEDRATTLPQPRRIARLWTKVNDARGYALLGDPSLRISA